MTNANAVSTPIETGWSSMDFEKKDCIAPYREAVGNLMFLQVVSRPDIMFAVNIAARAFENPSEGHWFIVKRIMRYLKGSVDIGLHYCKSGDFEA